MSVYRSLLTAVAALVLVSPVFAEEAPAVDQAAQPVAQTAEAPAVTVDATQEAKTDINKATIKELTKVKGITMVKAKAIVAYRKKNGDFKSLDELKNVKGFKKLKAEQMKVIQDQLSAG